MTGNGGIGEEDPAWADMRQLREAVHIALLLVVELGSVEGSRH
jgi:hypothetical protein